MLTISPSINKNQARLFSDVLKFKKSKNGISNKIPYLLIFFKKKTWSDQKKDIKINVKKINMDWLIGFLITRVMFLYLFLEHIKEIKKNIIAIAEILFEILIKKANKKSEKLDQESAWMEWENSLIK